MDKSLRLVQCAAHHRYNSEESSSTSILRPALTTALLVDKPRFLSLTLTATDPAASLLLEKRLLPRFTDNPSSLDNNGTDDDENNSSESNLLLGSKEDILVPITLDLRDLPLEATGIVCGVAGRLAAATHPRPVVDRLAMSMSMASLFSDSSDEQVRKPSSDNFMPSLQHRLDPPPGEDNAVEISFLSTARAGTVIVGERELERAIDALDDASRELDDSDESTAFAVDTNAISL